MIHSKITLIIIMNYVITLYNWSVSKILVSPYNHSERYPKSHQARCFTASEDWKFSEVSHIDVIPCSDLGSDHTYWSTFWYLYAHTFQFGGRLSQYRLKWNWVTGQLLIGRFSMAISSTIWKALEAIICLASLALSSQTAALSLSQ